MYRAPASSSPSGPCPSVVAVMTLDLAPACDKRHRAHGMFTLHLIVAFVPAPGCQDRVAAPYIHCVHLAGLTKFSEHRGPRPHLLLWPHEMCWSQVCAPTALQRTIHRTFSKATWLSGSLRPP